jgi:hypothetical protein
MPFKSKEFSDLPIQLGQLGLALDVQVRLGVIRVDFGMSAVRG